MVPRPDGYAEWLAGLRARIHAARQHAARVVNGHMPLVYWALGHELSHGRGNWGLAVVARASVDLRAASPDMHGCSTTNLEYMRSFAEAWSDFEDRQRTVGGLPRDHDVSLATRLENADARLTSAQAALADRRSRSVLDHLELQRDSVITLNGGKFKPGRIGQLGLAPAAIDAHVNIQDDGPSIDLLVWKTKHQVVSEFALPSSTNPIGLAEYQLVETLIGAELREAPRPASQSRPQRKRKADESCGA